MADRTKEKNRGNSSRVFFKPMYPGGLVPENTNQKNSYNASGKPNMAYNNQGVDYNASSLSNMGYENFTPPTVNYGMNAAGQKPQPMSPVPPSKPKQPALPTRLAGLLAMAYPAINFASSNPNNSYPGADATYGGYGGAQQGLTSRDGPSRNPDVGERLSRFQMPTKEQFDLSLLDPRTRRDAAAVVRAKQKPMYGSK